MTAGRFPYVEVVHTMSLRTDKVSGIITCVFGIIMIGFASLGLVAVAIQRVALSFMQPLPPLPHGGAGPGPSLIDGFNAIHGVFLVYLPLMIVGGVVFATSGFQVHRGSHTARRVAQANAICGYLWGIAYLISCYQIIDIVGSTPNPLPEPANTILQCFTFVFGALTIAAFPTGLLYILSRPRAEAVEQM